jgi:N-carbamoyl-L-amino-acid hydrolase
MPVTKFAPQCVDAVRSAAEKRNYSNMEMVSGAGHDSLYIASVAPASMFLCPVKMASHR